MGALRIQGKHHHLRASLLAKGGKGVLDGILTIALPHLHPRIHAIALQTLFQQIPKLGMLHVEGRPVFSPDLPVFPPGLHRTRGKDEQVQDQPPWRLGHRAYALVHQKPSQIPAHVARFGAFRRARVREQHADSRGLICRHSNRLQTSPAKTRRRLLQAARCNVFARKHATKCYRAPKSSRWCTGAVGCGESASNSNTSLPASVRPRLRDAS